MSSSSQTGSSVSASQNRMQIETNSLTDFIA